MLRGEATWMRGRKVLKTGDGSAASPSPFPFRPFSASYFSASDLA